MTDARRRVPSTARSWSIGRKVTLGFATALALVAVIDVVSYRSITTLDGTIQQVTHTHQLLDRLDAVLAHLRNAETGQRGYLLTDDERYLEPYHAATLRLTAEVGSLRRLTGGNDGQFGRLARLDTLIALKLAELDETIVLRRTLGFEAAADVVRTDRGKVIMDRIRALLNEMKAEELRALDLRSARTGAQIRATFYTIGVGSLVGLVLLGLAVYVIHIDIARRERAERALQAAHAGLEVRIQEATAELTRANGELATEIAERSSAEHRLAGVFAEVAKGHDDMRSILNRLQLGMAVINDEGRVEFLSDAAQRLVGRPPDEILGAPWYDMLPLADADRTQLAAAMATRGGRQPRIPVRLEHADGRQHWLNVDIQDDPRDARWKIVSLYDVTELYDLRRQLDQRTHFQSLVGRSAAMQQLYALIEELAKVDSTVLIEGETGTGKELVARAIHLSSARQGKPFIAINAAGLTDALLASQLFGHKRGAFTGAVADHHGFFEAADGGTLFLDEIGDIPLNVQVTLLRVLQEMEITRLGESRPRKIDVRVLAATQHDLAREVERGSFRADLLYRIRVARVPLPPLRERREDIPLLVEHFLAAARAAADTVQQHVGSDAMRLLLEHDWPGNVRELKSAIEFALIHRDGPVIRAEDLPPEVVGAVGGADRRRPATGATDGPTDGSTDERERILAALERADGNRSKAARLLGVSRATFYRRLARLGIE